MSWEQDGRRARRLATDIPGSVRGRSEREVRVVDLSRTGCLVRCGGRLDAGAILDLALTIDGEPFEAKVRVAEVSVDGNAPGPEPACLAGLSFLALPAHQETRLLAFLQRELRRQ